MTARAARSDGRAGVALIAALLTGLALLLLAGATATVALLDLQAARYVRASQRADAAARSGVELAEARLAAHLARDGSLPAEAPPLAPPGDLDVRWIDYRRLGERVCELEVEGRAAGASARAGARLTFP